MVTWQVINIPYIDAAAKTAAKNAHAHAHGMPLTLHGGPAGPAMTADGWVTFQWGQHAVLNLPGPLHHLSFCCGWPLPCICCCPGCCTPCGYTCCPPEGKGVSQAMLNGLVAKGPFHVQKLSKPGLMTAPTPATMVLN